MFDNGVFKCVNIKQNIQNVDVPVVPELLCHVQHGRRHSVSLRIRTK